MSASAYNVDHEVNTLEEHIASRLLRFRTQLNIPASQLAMFVGISEEELFEYEHGIEPIPASTLVLISAALGVDFDYFYKDEAPHFGRGTLAIESHVDTVEASAVVN